MQLIENKRCATTMRFKRNSHLNLDNKFFLAYKVEVKERLVPLNDGIPPRLYLDSTDFEILGVVQLDSKGNRLAEFYNIYISIHSFKSDNENELNFNPPFYPTSPDFNHIYLNCIIETGSRLNCHYQIRILIPTTPYLHMEYSKDNFPSGRGVWIPDLRHNVFSSDLILLRGTEQKAVTSNQLYDTPIDSKNVQVVDSKDGNNYLRIFSTTVDCDGILVKYVFIANMSKHPYFNSVKVRGNWIHVMNSNLTLLEAEIKAIQGEICVSYPSDPSLYATRENFIGLLFTGTVSYLYTGDCWSETRPTSKGQYRIPSQENTGEPSRHEGFLDPRTAKFEGFVVGGEAAYKHVKTHHPHAIIHLIRRPKASYLRVLCWLPEFVEMKKFGIIVTPSRKASVGKSNKDREKIDYLLEWDNSNPVHRSYIEDIPKNCVYPGETWKLDE